MLKVLHLIVAASVLSMTFCTAKNSTSPDSNSLIPFAVGNHWTYVDSSFDTTGRFTTFSLTQASVDTQLQIKYGARFFNVWKLHFSGSSTSNLYSDDSVGGVWNFGPIDSLDHMCLSAMNLAFKYPAMVGDKWSVASIRPNMTGRVLDSCSIDSITSKTCVASNAKYETQAGTFQCMEYQTITGYQTYSITNNVFYSPGIGLVGSVGLRNGTTVISRRVLQSYSIP